MVRQRQRRHQQHYDHRHDHSDQKLRPSHVRSAFLAVPAYSENLSYSIRDAGTPNSCSALTTFAIIGDGPHT